MEQSFLAWLRGRLRDFPQVAVGIGDDAAVLDIPAGHQLSLPPTRLSMGLTSWPISIRWPMWDTKRWP